ncbi:hypothetical protein B0H11DRAFT_1905840 [Mycena galericulata]|nr:hypothetical protein B0H11DRAFT_1905840 [Mycena galericulata]
MSRGIYLPSSCFMRAPTEHAKGNGNKKICHCKPTCGKFLSKRTRRRHYKDTDPLDQQPSESETDHSDVEMSPSATPIPTPQPLADIIWGNNLTDVDMESGSDLIEETMFNSGSLADQSHVDQESMDIDSCSCSEEDVDLGNTEDWLPFDEELDRDVPKSLEEMTKELDEMMFPEDEEMGYFNATQTPDKGVHGWVPSIMSGLRDMLARNRGCGTSDMYVYSLSLFAPPSIFNHSSLLRGWGHFDEYRPLLAYNSSIPASQCHTELIWCPHSVMIPVFPSCFVNIQFTYSPAGVPADRKPSASVPPTPHSHLSCLVQLLGSEDLQPPFPSVGLGRCRCKSVFHNLCLRCTLGLAPDAGRVQCRAWLPSVGRRRTSILPQNVGSFGTATSLRGFVVEMEYID